MNGVETEQRAADPPPAKNRAASDPGRRFKLAPGTQVRTEDTGLLFYTMIGPRLFFLPCGEWLAEEFFQGAVSLGDWVGHRAGLSGRANKGQDALLRALAQLEEKGVILGC